MLDERMRQMLDVASGLTGEDLDAVRTFAPAVSTITSTEAAETAVAEPAHPAGGDEHNDAAVIPEVGAVQTPRRASRKTHAPMPSPAATATRGEYERQRTRDSKVATSCLGREREQHEWWPVGTELVGHMGSQLFTAMVVENPQVKSGRSILITSGSASGRVCITPTRAAIEATEDYRQVHNLGRGGGVTNGWEFWQPQR